MRQPNSLRTRMAIAIGVLAILVVSAHSLGLYMAVEEREEDQIDRIVADEMEHLLERLRTNPATPAFRTHNLESFVARDDASLANVPAIFRKLPVGNHEIYDSGREYHVAVRAINGERVFLAYEATHHERQIREFAWLLVLGVAATAVLSAWLGYAMAGLLTEPLRDLARRVASLDPSSTPEPLLMRYADDELRRLAQAFDEYRARMAEFVAREREFTGNVSHELRTPLTAIRTGAELLAAKEDLPESARERAHRIQIAAERLAATVQSLLWLARDEARAPRDRVNAFDCVEEAFDPIREEAFEREVALRNDVDRSIVLHAERAVLVVVIANLVRNAVQSTRQGTVAVRYRDGVLDVTDTGVGISADELPHVFDRFYRGRDSGERAGFGLGLAIVRKLCDRYGWSVGAESQPGQGAHFFVRFSPGSSTSQ